jgi:hypothetical protein
MEVTLSYKQLAGIGVIVAVLAFGIGLVKSGAISLQLPQSQAQTQIEQEIISHVKNLQDDITAMQSSLNNFANLDSQIVNVQNVISDLEKRISATEAEYDTVEKLNSYIDTLQQKMVKLEREVQKLKASQEEIVKAQESKTVEQKVKEEPETETTSVPDQETSQQGTQAQDTPEQETPAEQVPSNNTKTLFLTINRSQYMVGDTVLINISTDEEASVELKIVSSTSVDVFKKVIKANSAGKIRVEYIIPDDVPAGGYKVIVTSGAKQKSMLFTVAKPPALPSASSESGKITIKTDKQTYGKGQYMVVSGNALPRGKVTIIVTTPSYNESVFLTQADEKGVYSRLVTIGLDSSSGEWTVSAKQGDEIATLRITVK